MKAVKVVVTGDFNAGKTTFVTTLSEVPPKGNEQRIYQKIEGVSKDTTTVDMDYGILTVDEGLVLQLFGTPGQARFEFMWEILARGMAAYVIMVDSTRPGTLDRTNYILDRFATFAHVPYVIAANKQDGYGALPSTYLRERLNLNPSVPILPSVAHNDESVREVLAALMDHAAQLHGTEAQGS